MTYNGIALIWKRTQTPKCHFTSCSMLHTRSDRFLFFKQCCDPFRTKRCHSISSKISKVLSVDFVQNAWSRHLSNLPLCAWPILRPVNAENFLAQVRVPFLTQSLCAVFWLCINLWRDELNKSIRYKSLQVSYSLSMQAIVTLQEFHGLHNASAPPAVLAPRLRPQGLQAHQATLRNVMKRPHPPSDKSPGLSRANGVMAIKQAHWDGINISTAFYITASARAIGVLLCTMYSVLQTSGIKLCRSLISSSCSWAQRLELRRWCFVSLYSSYIHLHCVRGSVCDVTAPVGICWVFPFIWESSVLVKEFCVPWPTS